MQTQHYHETLELRQQLVLLAKQLHLKNFLAAADGNISYRLNDKYILITPSGKNKARIQADDFAVITLDNKILWGHPSGERLMHLEVYRQCHQARCVVHAHPPYAIAWTITEDNHTELPNNVLSELILATGQIPIVPYARPGSLEMGKVLTPYLPQQRVFILKRHGALSWGEDMEEAYNGIERLEHTAYILALGRQLGRLNPLNEDEVQILKNMRQQLGEKTL